ncbi:Putative ankyrin repeat protein [Capnocytophaga canimorsus Cc5]|uniref:Ankyrin repeat protein n=1 Tax=Capnocytophaga canimorsus (strain 5) TaxID=860228 RepID=F9YTS1_CAPCC|nr:ankyrin repeat domain-containing protein [Capnocytophaga canimorsus]AEK24116.1 Putative ankyrin repeat protein [Capnocytophaga canimorsus Cc5]
MKKQLFLVFLWVFAFANAQQNIFHTTDFWKLNPKVEQVKQKITEGNSPTSLNERAYDAVSMAIINDASLEVISYLLSLEGNDVHKRTHDKRTYLFWAAMKGNLPLVEKFIKLGADVNLHDSHLYNPILFAAARGTDNQPVIELLIKNGADINYRNEQGANALLLAIGNMKDIKEADFFIKKGLSLKSTDHNGNNAAFYAARSGNETLVKQLKKQKINIKALNKKGENLMFAAAQGARMKTNTLDFFQFLEKQGISPNQPNNEGITPLMIVASSNKNLEVIDYFIKKGNDVNQVDKEGNTPLMWAALRNSHEVVVALTQHCKNIDTQNNEGFSALTQAVRGNTPEVVKFLLEKGADVTIKDKNQNTLAYHLLDNFSPRNLKAFEQKWKLLSDAGLDWTALQAENNTLYHIAVEKSSTDLVQKVSSVNNSINTKNDEGLTPLQKAAMTAKNTDLLHLLLKLGADKSVTTDFGETVLELAQENEFLNQHNLDFLRD